MGLNLVQFVLSKRNIEYQLSLLASVGIVCDAYQSKVLWQPFEISVYIVLFLTLSHHLVIFRKLFVKIRNNSEIPCTNPFHNIIFFSYSNQYWYFVFCLWNFEDIFPYLPLKTFASQIPFGMIFYFTLFCILDIAFCFSSFSICIESIWNTNDKGGRAVFPSSSNSPRRHSRGSNSTRSIFPPSVLRCSSVSIKKTQFPPLNMCPTNLTTFLVEKMQEILSNNDSKLKMWDLR